MLGVLSVLSVFRVPCTAQRVRVLYMHHARVLCVLCVLGVLGVCGIEGTSEWEGCWECYRVHE